jgi:hypothetical protein
MSPFEELLDYRRSVAELYGRLRRSELSQTERAMPGFSPGTGPAGFQSFAIAAFARAASGVHRSLLPSL